MEAERSVAPDNNQLAGGITPPALPGASTPPIVAPAAAPETPSLDQVQAPISKSAIAGALATSAAQWKDTLVTLRRDVAAEAEAIKQNTSFEFNETGLQNRAVQLERLILMARFIKEEANEITNLVKQTAALLDDAPEAQSSLTATGAAARKTRSKITGNAYGRRGNKAVEQPDGEAPQAEAVPPANPRGGLQNALNDKLTEVRDLLKAQSFADPTAGAPTVPVDEKVPAERVLLENKLVDYLAVRAAARRHAEDLISGVGFAAPAAGVVPAPAEITTQPPPSTPPTPAAANSNTAPLVTASDGAEAAPAAAPASAAATPPAEPAASPQTPTPPAPETGTPAATPAPAAAIPPAEPVAAPQTPAADAPASPAAESSGPAAQPASPAAGSAENTGASSAVAKRTDAESGNPPPPDAAPEAGPRKGPSSSRTIDVGLNQEIDCGVILGAKATLTKNEADGIWSLSLESQERGARSKAALTFILTESAGKDDEQVKAYVLGLISQHADPVTGKLFAEINSEGVSKGETVCKEILQSGLFRSKELQLAKLADVSFLGTGHSELIHLAGLNLSGCTLDNVVFRNVNLVGVNAANARFNNCTIDHCNAQYIDLRGAKFTGDKSLATNTDFSHGKIGTNAEGVLTDFGSSKLNKSTFEDLEGGGFTLSLAATVKKEIDRQIRQYEKECRDSHQPPNEADREHIRKSAALLNRRLVKENYQGMIFDDSLNSETKKLIESFSRSVNDSIDRKGRSFDLNGVEAFKAFLESPGIPTLPAGKANYDNLELWKNNPEQARRDVAGFTAYIFPRPEGTEALKVNTIPDQSQVRLTLVNLPNVSGGYVDANFNKKDGSLLAGEEIQVPNGSLSFSNVSNAIYAALLYSQGKEAGLDEFLKRLKQRKTDSSNPMTVD